MIEPLEIVEMGGAVTVVGGETGRVVGTVTAGASDVEGDVLLASGSVVAGEADARKPEGDVRFALIVAAMLRPDNSWRSKPGKGHA